MAKRKRVKEGSEVRVEVFGQEHKGVVVRYAEVVVVKLVEVGDMEVMVGEGDLKESG